MGRPLHVGVAVGVGNKVGVGVGVGNRVGVGVDVGVKVGEGVGTGVNVATGGVGDGAATTARSAAGLRDVRAAHPARHRSGSRTASSSQPRRGRAAWIRMGQGNRANPTRQCGVGEDNTGRFRTRSGPRRSVFGIGRSQWHEGFHRAMRMIAPEPERFAPALHGSGILCRHAFSALSNGPACLSTRGYHVTSALPTMSPISSPATG